MKGDFSRVTFKADNFFSQVLLKQGSVLLEADFNEQGAITAHALRQLIRDLLGLHAGPENNLGFAIQSSKAQQPLFDISPGRYYVDGLLAVNSPPPQYAEQKEVADSSPQQHDHRIELYKTQLGALETLGHPDFEEHSNQFFYLDVWEEPVTWLEDGRIREVALGGPDTSLRKRVTWRVQAKPVDIDAKGAAAKPEGWPEDWLASQVQRHHWQAQGKEARVYPQMQAWTDPKDNPDVTPCVADPLGGYQGLENQLYRVEIHQTDVSQAGDKVTTFKWSRDNGSVVAAWEETDGNDLIVGGVHDRVHGFAPGQWVELTNEIDQIKGIPGVLVRLVKVERERLTVDPNTIPAGFNMPPAWSNPIVRRWDHRESKDYDMLAGAIVVKDGKTYALERGIQIKFQRTFPDGRQAEFHPRDYWLFPARTATGDIEWPYHYDNKQNRVFEFLDPMGVHHAYAPLALVTQKPDKTFDITPFQRKIIRLWSNVS
jgi:hypothetical protein